MIQRTPGLTENMAIIHGIFCPRRVNPKGLGYLFDSLRNAFFTAGMTVGNAIIAAKFPQSQTSFF
jgi:hypothetical protein